MSVMPPPQITLRLSLEEVNLVLDALGQQPFSRVYQLIGAIQQQAEKQLTGEGASE